MKELVVVHGSWGECNVPWFPPELAGADGYVGCHGDLSPSTLLRAYAQGVFPWYSEGDPILWWSPDPRGIIELHPHPAEHPPATPGYGGLHVSRRLLRTIRSGKFRVTVNHCFETVMRSCGEARPEGTWVTPEMLEAYTRLHHLGFAHSVETWVADPHGGPDILAGGTYGVALGGLFAAESMFYRVPDGSKVALAALVQRLIERGFVLLDVQMTTEHTRRMGAIDIPRREYLRRLSQAIRLSDVRFV